jgi:branched-chain amino acid transport system permease protein
VRDNPERVEFIGYDTQWVRYLVLILSSFFAGIAGGLSAINFEIVSAENVSAIRSGSILLFTFIGGIGFFFGPLLGAIVGILFSVLLSDYTPAWQLYLGLFFVLLVRYAPGGLGSLIMLLLRAAKYGQWRRIAGPLARVCLAVLPALLGFIAGVEMVYHVTMEAANGSVKQLFGMQADTHSALPWCVAGGLLLAGMLGWRKAQPAYAHAWNEASAAIAEKIRSER